MRVVHTSSAKYRPPAPERFGPAVSEGEAAASPPCPGDAEVIEQVILRAFDLAERSLRGRHRGRAPVAFARQVAMYVAHVHLGLSFTAAARLFGRDRTTAAHACRIVEDRRDRPAVDRLIGIVEEALVGRVIARPVGGRAVRRRQLQ